MQEQEHEQLVGLQQTGRQAELTIAQQQQQQHQQQRFNQRRHFGVAKQLNSSSGNLNTTASRVAAGAASTQRGSISETMRIFERSQHQQSYRKQPTAAKEPHGGTGGGATPSTPALPPLEAAARRSNASSNQQQQPQSMRPTATATDEGVRHPQVDANQNYLPIITTSRSDGKLPSRQQYQQQQQHHRQQQQLLQLSQQSLTAAAAAADAKSETHAEPPTVRPTKAQPTHYEHQQQLLSKQLQTSRKSAARRRRVKGAGGGGGRQKAAAGAAAAARKPKQIPIVYFGQENGSVRSAKLEDVDARSCDMRDPNATVAYSNVLDYIRDNQLMNNRKAKLIWSWLKESDESASLFVYDPNLRWYSLPGDLIGAADV